MTKPRYHLYAVGELFHIAEMRGDRYLSQTEIVKRLNDTDAALRQARLALDTVVNDEYGICFCGDIHPIHDPDCRMGPALATIDAALGSEANQVKEKQNGG